MNYVSMRKHLQTGLILAVLVMMAVGVSSGKTIQNEAVVKGTSKAESPSGKGASVSIIPSRNGQFIIQGNNVDDIAGVDLTISYDSSTLSAPTVTKNPVISEAMMSANTATPGTIRFVMISPKPFSGTAQLATISFATVKGKGGMSITSVSLVNIKGVLVK
jgi:hypothetical protein